MDMSESRSFNEQATGLIEETMSLVKQVMVKHSAAVLSEMHDQIVSRNERIASLETALAESEAARKRLEAELAQVRRDLNAAMPRICCEKFKECDVGNCVPKLWAEIAAVREIANRAVASIGSFDTGLQRHYQVMLDAARKP
jgi:hypothetical protein